MPVSNLLRLCSFIAKLMLTPGPSAQVVSIYLRAVQRKIDVLLLCHFKTIERRTPQCFKRINQDFAKVRKSILYIFFPMPIQDPPFILWLFGWEGPTRRFGALYLQNRVRKTENDELSDQHSLAISLTASSSSDQINVISPRV